MATAVKIILRTILGAVCGAISGAALLGLPTYFSTDSGFLGPESAWATLAAIVGGIWGSVLGALIAFLVAKFETNKLISAIAGAAVGISLVGGLLLFGMDPLIDSEMFATVLASIPIGSLIAVIVSATNRAPVDVAINEVAD